MAVRIICIPNCDTVRAARRWLDDRGVVHEFHDLRRDGLPGELDQWLGEYGQRTVINTRSATWRTLSVDEREQALDSPAGALAAIAAQPTLLKRPVLVAPGGSAVGFEAKRWEALIRDC